jgi:hypothetical protein
VRAGRQLGIGGRCGVGGLGVGGGAVADVAKFRLKEENRRNGLKHFSSFTSDVGGMLEAEAKFQDGRETQSLPKELFTINFTCFTAYNRLYGLALSRISIYFRNVKNPHYTENMFFLTLLVHPPYCRERE